MAKLMFSRVQEISHSFQIRKASHLAHVMFIPPCGNQPSSSSMILYIHFLCSTLYECNITTCKYLTWIQETIYYYYIIFWGETLNIKTIIVIIINNNNIILLEMTCGFINPRLVFCFDGGLVE